MMKSVMTQSHQKTNGPFYRLFLLLGVLMISGCASTGKPLSDPVNDPWEPFNRGVYKFNSAVDKAVLRPIAKGYDKITPEPVQRGFGNFVRNLSTPSTIINLALQGKFKKSAVSTGRFLVNSTIGLLGFFDVASKADIPVYQEDFGQTLAVWGYKNSRYVMLPIFGPSTFRDGIGQIGDSYTDPVSYLAREEKEYRPMILKVLGTRVNLFSEDKTIEEAYDPYLLIRDVWLQQREYDVYDGDVPLPDYDEYLLDEQ